MIPGTSGRFLRPSLRAAVLTLATLAVVGQLRPIGLAAQEPVAPAAPEQSATIEKLDPSNLANLKLMVFPARPIGAPDDETANNPELNASLSAILRNRALQTPFTLKVVTDWTEIDGAISGDEAADPALEAARAAGAQATLSLAWFQEGRRVTLIAKVYDVWQRRMVAGSSLAGLDDLTLLNTTDTLLGELLDKIQAEAPRILAEWGTEGGVAISRELVITCPAEGATVSLVGGERLGTISGGRIELPFRPLAVNQDIQFRLEKAGFYPKTVSLPVTSTKPEVRLPALYPETRFTALLSADPTMLLGSARAKLGLGGAFRWFPVADSFFVQGGYRFNLAGNPSDPGGTFTKDLSLHQISLEAAIALLTPPDWVVRAFVGLGLGAWLSASPQAGGPVFFDPYLELPCLILQLNLHPIAIELEFGAEFVFDSAANVLPPGLVRTLGPTRFSLGWKL